MKYLIMSVPSAIGILILVASVCTAQILFRLGLPVAHDMVFHLFQADQFHRDIASGIFLPRWSLSANNGYGSPNFIFYAPLGYYLASLIRVLTPSPVISVIITIWSGFLLSGAAMYLAVKNISGSRGALLAATFYQVLPFHLLNLYGRGAFAELCACAWLPLVILFVHETLSERSSPLAAAGLSLSYAGLILTHLVSAFMFTFVILLYMLSLLQKAKSPLPLGGGGSGWGGSCHEIARLPLHPPPNPLPSREGEGLLQEALLCHYFYRTSGKKLLAALFSLAAGIGISSFYLLPAIFERKYVQMGYLFNYVFSDYNRNFLFLENAFDSSFRVALHGAVVLELILFLTIVPWLFRESGNRPDMPHNAALSIIFLSALLLATPLSAPLWRLFAGLAILQFPWRWVSVMELSLCFLVGAFFSGTGARDLLNAGRQRRMALYSMMAILCLSFALIVKSGAMHAAPFLAGITDAEQVKRYANMPREYTPIWAADVEKTITEEKTEKISAMSGKAGFRIMEWDPELRVIAISASTPVLLRIATFYYPGWSARLDGKECAVSIEPKSGAMLVNAPGGEHTLKLSFGATPLRVFSRYVSFGSCAILAAFVFQIRTRRRGDHGEMQITTK